MEIKYFYRYDFIPDEIVEGEENYNEERQARIEETIDHTLQPFQATLAEQNITFEKSSEEGKGIIKFTNLTPDMEIYSEIDKALGEIGLEPTTVDQIKKEESHNPQSPETHTMLQDRTAENTLGKDVE